jgi:hypothetical protein
MQEVLEVQPCCLALLGLKSPETPSSKVPDFCSASLAGFDSAVDKQSLAMSLRLPLRMTPAQIVTSDFCQNLIRRRGHFLGFDCL